MSTIGLVMITGIGDVKGNSDLIGIAFGVGAAFFYATVILLNKFIKNVSFFLQLTICIRNEIT